MECFRNSNNIKFPEKCDCKISSSKVKYCTNKCNPEEHKLLMIEQKKMRNKFKQISKNIKKKK